MSAGPCPIHPSGYLDDCGHFRPVVPVETEKQMTTELIEVDPYDLSDEQSDEVTRLVEAEIAARPKQTVFDGENGDCLRACVALITGLPVETVPNFSTFRASWFEGLLLWADARGFEVLPVNPAQWNEPVLAFGQSPRGLRHAVVWLGDSMLHDPHPDGTGLTSVESEFWAVSLRVDPDADMAKS